MPLPSRPIDHQMVPGSHERTTGPECRCGRSWPCEERARLCRPCPMCGVSTGGTHCSQCKAVGARDSDLYDDWN